MHLVYVVYLILKILPVPVPAQGRYALTRLRVPDLDGLVIASTCYAVPVWAPSDGVDTAVFDDMIQHTKQLRQGKNIRWEKKYLTNLSARSAGTQIGEIKQKNRSQRANR
jgi:hypothetical protein